MSTATSTKAQYTMTLSLNVLNHLGLNLYSSNPAVLSEAVANAWDADATRVDINLDTTNGRIVLQDNGHGMTIEDINRRFLRVGYQRRKEDGPATTPAGRAVMGRKGIGKLAMFGIANTILIETARDGQKNALRMNLDDINAVMSGSDPSANQAYAPAEADPSSIDFTHGTRITLTDLKKNLNQTAPYLRQRLARRFSIIGSGEKFQVFVSGKEISADETKMEKLSQYIWIYGDRAYINKIKSNVGSDCKIFERPATTSGSRTVRGWIGTARQPSALKGGAAGESLNRIPIFVRGKLAQEDTLDEIDEVGIYKNYLLGAIHADFLDEDKDVDIATSSRQKIKEDDPRYEDLRIWIKAELIYVKSQWTDLRNEDGTVVAEGNPAIKEWFKSLEGDRKKKAQRLFGKINQLGLEPDDANDLCAYGVLAFETMSQKDNLEALDAISPENLVALGSLLTNAADLEAAMYHRIVRSRLAVIEKLDDLIDDDAQEKFLQKHLFEHLWLLDPSWERASVPTMEKRIGAEFDTLNSRIKDEERDSRYDIRYQKASGMHVIVELKRASVVTNSLALLQQIQKYRDALRQYLKANNQEHEPVSVVCVVGKPLTDWTSIDGKGESIALLAAKQTRVVSYDELLTNAHASYREYLEEREAVGRVQAVLDSIAKTP